MNLALDPINHDLYLDANGQISITPAPLDQRIDCRLRTFLGEFWLDVTLGIPYFQEILKKNPDMQAVRAAFASEIQKVPGVKTLESLEVSMDRAQRKLTVTFSVTGTDSLIYFKTTEVSA
jgi:hypothetical protein